MGWVRNGDSGAALMEVCRGGATPTSVYLASLISRSSAATSLRTYRGEMPVSTRLRRRHSLSTRGVFPRHAGHRRQIGVADLLVEHDASRAGRRSDEFRQLEQRAGHACLN